MRVDTISVAKLEAMRAALASHDADAELLGPDAQQIGESLYAAIETLGNEAAGIQRDDAIARCEKALDVDSTYGKAHFLLGLMHWENGDFPPARKQRCTLVARVYGRCSRPVNTSLNCTIPAFTNSRVGSFWGTSGELRTTS